MQWDDWDDDSIVDDVYDDIQQRIVASDPVVEEVLKKLFSRRGKGVRPVITALTGKLVGGAWERLRLPAMIIEAIHIASLIHDDVVDDADMRRGAETLNVRYSERASVLFGDFIFIKALEIAHTLEHPEAVSIIFRAVERMLEGEMAEELSDGFVDEQTYLGIIGNKTASLFAAAGELGVLFSEGSIAQRELGREFGEAVGMAFQIVDDTLDLTGDQDVMGKPRFADVVSCRFTLPVIHALRDSDHEEIRLLFADRDAAVSRIDDIVRSSGGIEYAHDTARLYSKKARDIAQQLDNAGDFNIFGKFFDQLVTRAS